MGKCPQGILQVQTKSIIKEMTQMGISFSKASMTIVDRKSTMTNTRQI